MGERTFGQVEELVRGALRAKFATSDDQYIWVRDITAEWVVWTAEGTSTPGMFKATYTIDDNGDVTLGEPAKVDARTEYEVVEAVHREPGRVLEARGKDAAGGRVFHVRIIEAGDSLNGRRYPLSVLREAAALYEGAKAFDHHRTESELKTSTVDGLVGGYRNVTADATGLVGDLHVLPSATRVAEALDQSLDAQAEGLPPLIGISHDVAAEFKISKDTTGGRRLQEATKIVRVLSADVVADPSAGGKAIRMVAGGTDPHVSEQPIPEDHKKENTMTLAEMLASATDEDKQSLRALLGEAPATNTTTTDTTTDDEPTTDDDKILVGAGAAKESIATKMLVRESVTAAGLDPKHVETVMADLPARVTEADITQALGRVRRVIEGTEKKDLAPKTTGGAVVTVDQLDKTKDRVYNTLCRNWQEGFTSYFEMYEAVTGQRLRSDVDGAAEFVRESWSRSRIVGNRATESVDTTSWAEVLGDSVARRLIDMYLAPQYQSWRKIVRTAPVKDFRTNRRTRLGGFGDLPVVLQGGTYQGMVSQSDEEATYAVVKRGGTEDLTMEAVMNDDLGAIARIPEELGRAAARTLHKFVWLNNFASNPVCTYDSVALFAAGHNNTTAVALSNAGMNTCRQLMRDQPGFGVAGEPLGITPKFLIVPNELEDLGNQLASGQRAVPATTPGATDVPNLHQGTELIVVDHFTDANDWYMAADPADIPSIEIGFLSGKEDPELFMQDDPKVGAVFSSDKVSWKIRHIYSGTVLDHRFAQRGTQ
jgi:hypothetical protein